MTDDLKTIESLMYKDLAAALAEMPAVKFDSVNPFLKNRFASLGAMIETARPILAKYGLAVVQLPYNELLQNGGTRVGVRTIITHRDGGTIEAGLSLPLTDEKGKSLAQGAGSIITYLRRYSYAAALGLYAEEDTDGEPQRQVTIPESDKGQKQPHKATKKKNVRSWPGDLVIRLVREVDNIKAAPHAVNVLNQSPFKDDPDDELEYGAIIAWAKTRKDDED